MIVSFVTLEDQIVFLNLAREMASEGQRRRRLQLIWDQLTRDSTAKRSVSLNACKGLSHRGVEPLHEDGHYNITPFTGMSNADGDC